MYNAIVLADSVSPDGLRLTTLQLRYPRFIHPEMLTHRVFSRNSSSSRAKSVARIISEIENDPVNPVQWGEEKKGMQAGGKIDENREKLAQMTWDDARKSAIAAARQMMGLRVHKQVVNRLLEPFVWIDTVLTGTDFENFYNLRCHPDAQPEMQKIAYMMRDAMDASTPSPVGIGYWHMPYLSGQPKENASIDNLLKISAARCARVSYSASGGADRPEGVDIDLANHLVASQHWSPFEHQATPAPDALSPVDNLQGWVTHRRILETKAAREALAVQ